MKSYENLKANVTAASLELPKLEDEAATVEAQRLLWVDQWQNISALQRQLDQAKFDQQIANEIILQKEASFLYALIYHLSVCLFVYKQYLNRRSRETWIIKVYKLVPAKLGCFVK
jgi:hypothetical protein